MNTLGEPEITEKQYSFIKDLAVQRATWSVKIKDVECVRVIMNVKRNAYDSTAQLVTRKQASSTIAALLAVPTSIAPVPTGKLSPKDAAQQTLINIPASGKGIKYAIKNTDPDAHAYNTWVFYEVRLYKGRKYVNRLLGSPGDWNRKFVPYAAYASVAQRIADATYVTNESESLSGPMAAAARFSDTYQVCACCGAKLSNGKSIAAKFGPICAKKF